MNILSRKYLVRTIIVINIVLIVSCVNSQKSNERLIKSVCNKYSFLPRDNWVIEEKITTNCDLDLALLREQNDTSIYISTYISFVNCDQDSMFIFLNDYIKIYDYYGKRCFLAYDETNTPKYRYYKCDEFEDSIVFDFGKYQYLYDKDYLNRYQSLYYEQNKDSLDRIQGDDLPVLPGLSLKNKE